MPNGETAHDEGWFCLLPPSCYCEKDIESNSDPDEAIDTEYSFIGKEGHDTIFYGSPVDSPNVFVGNHESLYDFFPFPPTYPERAGPSSMTSTIVESENIAKAVHATSSSCQTTDTASSLSPRSMNGSERIGPSGPKYNYIPAENYRPGFLSRKESADSLKSPISRLTSDTARTSDKLGFAKGQTLSILNSKISTCIPEVGEGEEAATN